jgi:myo-inositol catabolism protein IolS
MPTSPLHPSPPSQLSPLALGCWGFADGKLFGSTEEQQAIATVQAAVDHGMSALDTAPGYGSGRSEEIVGRALRGGRRDRAYIATKVSTANFSARGVRESCEASLRRLQTETIDLLQIHWAGADACFDEVIASFEALRDEGKIQACGVCNFGPAHLQRLRTVGHGWLTNQLPYNLLWRAIEFEIVELCQRDGLGILAYSPLQQGLLTDRWKHADEVPEGRSRSRHFRGNRPMGRHGGPGFEAETFAALEAIRSVAERAGRPMGHVAIAWLRQQPGVSSVLTGARSPAQVEDNLAALSLTLDAESLAELDRATLDLKGKLGPDPDMWAPESRYR